MTNRKQRLLLIDDDPLVLRQVALRLRGYGYHVTATNDGIEALLRLDAEEWDLVLLDLLMPGPTGLEVLRQIRRTHSLLSLPVIMVTSRGERGQIVQALDAGANDYLIKPLDFDIALARIRTQLNCNALAEAKDDFLSFASHDLKKPLMLMQDIAGELYHQLSPGSLVGNQPQKDLQCLIRTARQMMDVVEGFLNKDSFRSGAVKLDLQATSLESVVGEVMRENRTYAISKRIELVSDIPAEIPPIQADPQKIRGVIDNLVGNAIKFGPDGSRVTVSARVGQNNVYIKVRDSGPGLSAADLQKLFAKRAVLSNKPTGHEVSTGIGLFLCGSLIAQHGGQIGAENNADRGATFWIALPVWDPVAPGGCAATQHA